MAELSVEWFKDKEQNKAGKDRAERTALGEAFMLKEGVKGEVGATIPAVVGVFVKEIKEGKERAERFMGFEDMTAGVARD